MPKAVIFDVDGTLIDSVDPPAKSWQDAFGEYGREIPFDDIRSQIGNQLMPVFLSEYDIEAFGEELEERWGVILKERYLSTVEAFPGVRTLFEHLRSEGLRIAVASSSKRDELETSKPARPVRQLAIVRGRGRRACVMSRPMAWTLATVLCAGCALATATPPQVEVAAVELRGAGLLDQTLSVTLCVTNPNNSELAFRRIQVAVDAAGRPLAEGVSEAPVRLPPRSSVLVPFTVVSTVRNLVPQLFGVLSSGAVEYRVHGSITLETLGITVPFSRSGRLGLLTGGQQLLADAVAPRTLRCTTPG